MTIKYHLFEAHVPPKLKQLVFELLVNGPPDAKELCAEFYSKPYVEQTNVAKFIDALGDCVNLDTYNYFVQQYGVNKPGFSLYHRILNRIRTEFVHNEEDNLLETVNRVYGGILWNSGGNCMIVSIPVSMRHCIMVSDEYISYQEIPENNGDCSFEDFIYLDCGEAELFGDSF